MLQYALPDEQCLYTGEHDSQARIYKFLPPSSSLYDVTAEMFSQDSITCNINESNYNVTQERQWKVNESACDGHCLVFIMRIRAVDDHSHNNGNDK